MQDNDGSCILSFVIDFFCGSGKLHDFAVQFYDVSFKYKGKSYYLLSDNDHVAVCDSHFSEEFETFKDAVELIENYHIDGRSLLELIDSLEDVEPE